MKKLLLTAATAALLGPLVQAQAASFEGFSVGLAATSANTTTEDVLNGVSQSVSDTDSNAVLQLQYTSAITDTFMLGAGLTANLSDLKSGNFGNNQTKLKNGYSLYLAPGIAFNNNWMGYAKVAYVNASLQNSSGSTVNFDTGWGLGLGVQAMFGKNWFGQAEYMADQYNDRNPVPNDTVKLKSNIFSLAVGYKF